MFNDCELYRTQIFRTNLKGIDFSTCNIEGFVVDKDNLKGMVVNQFQAVELSKLLGIVVK